MNAEEARNKAIESHKKELESVLWNINLRAERGDYHYETYGSLSEYTINELKKMGYEAKNFTDHHEIAAPYLGGPITGIAEIISSDRMFIVKWKPLQTTNTES